MRQNKINIHNLFQILYPCHSHKSIYKHNLNYRISLKYFSEEAYKNPAGDTLVSPDEQTELLGVFESTVRALHLKVSLQLVLNVIN